MVRLAPPSFRDQLAPDDDHLARRFDSEPDLTSVEAHDGDADVVADVELFHQFSGQDQHGTVPRDGSPWARAPRVLAPNRSPTGDRLLGPMVGPGARVWPRRRLIHRTPAPRILPGDHHHGWMRGLTS
jgi:hypothetical protein